MTAIEKSWDKESKQNIKYDKCPINLGMVEDIWHFDKNAYFRMNVSLVAQVLPGSVAAMVWDAIRDRGVKLQITNKNM